MKIFVLLLATAAIGLGLIAGFTSAGTDPVVLEGVTLVSDNEADRIEGGAVCLWLAYIHLPYVGGCGGPTKDCQSRCKKTPTVGPGFGARHTWYYRDCLECGEKCGSYQYINPRSCAKEVVGAW